MWRDASFAPQAAEAMRISARELKNFDLIDDLVPEPLGGAHRDHQGAANNLKATLCQQIADLKRIPLDELLEQRYQKFRRIGKYGVAEPAIAGVADSHEAQQPAK